MPPYPPSRRGTLLIIVAGVVALLAALAIGMLVRMRSDADEMALVEQEAQVRIMLSAALSYIDEAGRLGYDSDSAFATVRHREGCGWIDVRDGQLGPRDNLDPLASEPLFSWSSRDPEGRRGYRAWPAPDSIARCPMHVLTRPHFAVRPTVAPNPIDADPASPRFGLPLLTNKDPLPVESTPGVFDFGGPSPGFRGWDPRPRMETTGRAWFRAYRLDVAPTTAATAPDASWATFVVTCGSGGTLGWRDWNEVEAAGAAATFGDDPRLFGDLSAHEIRAWYRVEWSPYVAPNDCHNAHPYIEGQWSPFDSFMSFSPNASDCWTSDGSTSGQSSWATTPHVVNQVGTFRYVQRLRVAPERW